MGFKSKQYTDTNTSTKTITYTKQDNATIDDCIKFCLEKARDDKNNSGMYLRIIKYLLDKSPVEWHYHPQPHYPNITYTNDNKQPDWDYNKVYCGIKIDPKDSNDHISSKGYVADEKL